MDLAPQPLHSRDPNTVLSVTPAKEGGAKQRKSSKKSAPAKAASDAPSTAELSKVYLDGEERGAVPIYDTCDDLRKKIDEHLKTTSQAAFCRELAELVPSDKVSAAQMTAFRKFKGPRAGGHSPAFYAGYVYFEKQRIHLGKKTSAKREKLEEAWKREGGFPREGSHNVHIWCGKGESWHFDSLGQLQIRGRK